MSVFYESKNGVLYNNDTLTQLKLLPDNSVDCVVTSPPYWALRDYGIERQLGLEPTFHEYLEKLWVIFDEIYRILKPTGTCWVNLGDSYSSGVNNNDKKKVTGAKKVKPIKAKLPQKSLCQIPSRFSIGMADRGWILRNEIIWHKPNAMPSSVKDRFTVDFEKIFFFVKQKKYYFEQQLEPMKNDFETYKKKLPKSHSNKTLKESGQGLIKYGNTILKNYWRGRNKRTVWSISTKPFKDAHFAVFPPEIPENCIKAGCPEYVCANCGRPREKILERIIKTGKVKDVRGKYINADKLVHSPGSRKIYYTKVRRYKIPKSMQIAFVKWLRKYIKGKTDLLDEVFGNHKWSHWVRIDDSGQSLPTPEDYLKLKSVLNLPDDWDKWLLETVETLVDSKGESYREYGWSEYCSCGSDKWENGIVLDPFMGSGTTAIVAEKLNRRWIGIELNQEYCEIAKRRILASRRLI